VEAPAAELCDARGGPGRGALRRPWRPRPRSSAAPVEAPAAELCGTCGGPGRGALRHL